MLRERDWTVDAEFLEADAGYVDRPPTGLGHVFTWRFNRRFVVKPPAFLFVFYVGGWIVSCVLSVLTYLLAPGAEGDPTGAAKFYFVVAVFPATVVWATAKAIGAALDGRKSCPGHAARPRLRLPSPTAAAGATAARRNRQSHVSGMCPDAAIRFPSHEGKRTM
jgi:hypothetical protein